MGEVTKIEWANSTFNPWIGCTKVSPGCANCYAEREFNYRHHKAKWGAGEPRVRTSAGTWAQPLRWNRAAAKAGMRARVFCASLADVFDPEVPIEWLDNLFDLIDQCQNLDWLLLTKRPHLIMSRIGDVFERHLNGGGRGPDFASCWIGGMPPPNVWIGTTVEDQQRADERIPELLKVPARVRFLSCEPLLGAITLPHGATHESDDSMPGVHWIICGGESGPHARPMHPEWARSLRDQAQAGGVPFFFKQWGEWLPGHQYDAEHRKADPGIESSRFEIAEWDGEEWSPPADPCDTDDHAVFRVGKKRAGRRLDGRTWDGVPS